MTNREFFKSVLALPNLPEELKIFAEEGIVKLDNRNANRSSKPTKVQKENEPLYAKIMEILAEGGKLGIEIASALDLSTNKVSGLCGVLAKEGKIIVEERKIPKTGVRKFYRIATEEDNAVEENEG